MVVDYRCDPVAPTQVTFSVRPHFSPAPVARVRLAPAGEGGELLELPPADPAALAAWRAAMVPRADAWWLRLLAAEDPALIAAGLRARAGAFGQFDAALREAAEAAVETIVNL